MIEKARDNAQKLGYSNVEFRQGDIENIPVSDNVADVIISNCVLNLVPDKEKVFQEIFRVLKQGGHFSISDVVLIGQLPEALQRNAEMYAGCISGAIQKEEYLDMVRKNGFSNISIQNEKAINIPNDILKNYLSSDELQNYKSNKMGIFSITVYAEKPKNCGCGTGCCN